MPITNRHSSPQDVIQQVKEELAQTHPELDHLTNQEILSLHQQNLQKKEQQNARRLKDHLEMFSDAVIAIVMTVMLLEIPLPHNGDNLQQFFTSILIFLVTFFIVADKWWDNHTLYDAAEAITPKIVIMQFLFMAALSLLPIFARWMMMQITTVSVMSYGMILLVVHFFHWGVHFFLSQERFSDTTYLKKIIQKTNYGRLITALFLGLLGILCAFIQPSLAFVFYLLNPLFSFWHSLHPKRRQKQTFEKLLTHASKEESL